MPRRKIYKMFFKQFSKITNVDTSTIRKFDAWLISLPKHLQKNITISGASARSGIEYSQVNKLLSFAYDENILSKHFLVKCPHCGAILQSIESNEIISTLGNNLECDECGDICITTDDILIAYELIEHPSVNDNDLPSITSSEENSDASNFLPADSLSYQLHNLYEAFYNPDESAYIHFSKLRDALDLDYGTNNTAKGNALEKLVLALFSEIQHIKGTNKIKTNTNQFDCTFISAIKTCYPSIFDYLSPYFIVECKNEKKKPDNTYTNKLESIIRTNDAKLGIIVGRSNATNTCFTLSREHYLTTMNSNCPKIIITLSDDDLKKIIDDHVNLLLFLQYKIFQVTSNSPNAQYEYFIESQESATA